MRRGKQSTSTILRTQKQTELFLHPKQNEIIADLALNHCLFPDCKTFSGSGNENPKYSSKKQILKDFQSNCSGSGWASKCRNHALNQCTCQSGVWHTHLRDFLYKLLWMHEHKIPVSKAQCLQQLQTEIIRLLFFQQSPFWSFMWDR